MSDSTAYDAEIISCQIIIIMHVCALTLTMLKYFCIHDGERSCFFQFQIILSVLVSSFLQLCQCGDRLPTSESDVLRRSSRQKS